MKRRDIIFSRAFSRSPAHMRLEQASPAWLASMATFFPFKSSARLMLG